MYVYDALFVWLQNNQWFEGVIYILLKMSTVEFCFKAATPTVMLTDLAFPTQNMGQQNNTPVMALPSLCGTNVLTKGQPIKIP
jgi:hypothetical protein